MAFQNETSRTPGRGQLAEGTTIIGVHGWRTCLPACFHSQAENQLSLPLYRAAIVTVCIGRPATLTRPERTFSSSRGEEEATPPAPIADIPGESLSLREPL